MTNKDEYNGWTNWETWNLGLWATTEYKDYIYIKSHKPYAPFKAQLIGLEIYPEGTPDMKVPHEMDKVNWEEIQKVTRKNKIERLKTSEFTLSNFLEYLQAREVSDDSIVTKQAIIETGWFKSRLAKKNNNYI